MQPLTRYSEPYQATGGLAAIGVLNQLGRPDIEPLEVLVREAVQNCWDARDPASSGIRVEIARRTLNAEQVARIRSEVLVDPPTGLPLAATLHPGLTTLHFADFGTRGLGGPTRADREGGGIRDFVDFVRNIGQPPDNELGGGSFGYGKAAFYIASAARTIVVDTLCTAPDGQLERRLLGCALGDNFSENGAPHTGRHWWGRIVDGVPEPLTGTDAEQAAAILGLPERRGSDGRGTTVLVVAPDVSPESEEPDDATIPFIGEALAWNFWPRMVSTPGGRQSSMRFTLRDDDRRIRVPDPRIHPRLRDFVEALDRLREEPDGTEDEWTLDRPIRCLRPVATLGRVVIRKGVSAPVELPARAVPLGARVTAAAVHHVALMRQAELVVTYMPGPASVAGRVGYSGVFQSAPEVDEAFRRSEPPTHDDWNHRFIPVGDGYAKRYVKIALQRIAKICREAAGYDGTVATAGEVEEIPLGRFADALAALMPGAEGTGARRPSTTGTGRPRRPRTRPGSSVATEAADGVWVDGPEPTATPGNAEESGANRSSGDGTQRPQRRPQTLPAGDPEPAITDDGRAVLRYPFQLRTHDNAVRLRARVEVMTNDGVQVESDPPAGYEAPDVSGWIDPDGRHVAAATHTLEPGYGDGRWIVEIPLQPDVMVRVDIEPEIVL